MRAYLGNALQAGEGEDVREQAAAAKQYETFEGVIQSFRYRGEDGGFVIAYLSDGLCIKGTMPTAKLNVAYELTGEWEENPRFGRQFKVVSYQTVFPASIEGIRNYLRYNVKWIGPVVSKALIDTYGEQALLMIKKHPEEVAAAIKGITLERAREMQTEMHAMEAQERLQVELEGLFADTKVNRNLIADVIRRWGENAPKFIRENPYAMIDAFHGVGFITADSVALKLKFAKNSSFRVAAGLDYSLAGASSDGHVCLPAIELERRATRLLGVGLSDLRPVIQEMVNTGQVVEDNRNYFLPGPFKDEQYIAGRVRDLLHGDWDPVQPDMADLAADQRIALEQLCAGKNMGIFILTGAPGTGKTFLVKRIITSFPGKVIELLAPTGKAAKRMQEQTMMDASTIHRALEPIPESGLTLFRRTHDNPLDGNIIIVDEASMLDNWLFARLLEAVGDHSRLILIGDIHQLPSVGAGSILRDLIAAHIPSVELDTIKRQDAGLIIKNCHKIKRGIDIETPMSFDEGPGDFVFIPRDTAPKIESGILAVIDRLVKKYNYDPLIDIQIITPRRTGSELSCEKLNPVLQQRLVGKPEDGKPYQHGDKVIQTRNVYTEDLVNGDIGRVAEVIGKEMWVKFENPYREIKMGLWGNSLELAYAITCHKFQGSECKVVIIPVFKGFGSMICQRNWLYTAISRAQKLCILIGQREEITKMIWRRQQQVRYTRLRDLLLGKEEAPLTNPGDFIVN